MELSDVTERLDSLRPDDEEIRPIHILAAKVGQAATFEERVRGEKDDLSPSEEEHVAEHRRDVIGGVVTAAAEYAAVKDIDFEEAVDERVELMEERAEKREKMAEAMESGDPTEVTSVLEDDDEVSDDDSDPRGFH